MSQIQVVAGTSEEIIALLQSGAFAGEKLQVFVEVTEDVSAGLSAPPNSIQNGEHLEQLLLDGLNSGSAIPVTDAMWEDVRCEVRTHATQRKGEVPITDREEDRV